jgi:hypothetical protein
MYESCVNRTLSTQAGFFQFGLIKQNIHKNQTRMCGQSRTPESSKADCWHVFAFLYSYVTRFNTY